MHSPAPERANLVVEPLVVPNIVDGCQKFAPKNIITLTIRDPMFVSSSRVSPGKSDLRPWLCGLEAARGLT